MFAVPLVFENLGIAIAARMPMTTMNRTVRVKPVRP